MRALIIEQEALIACSIEDALRDIGFTSFDFACTVEDAVRVARRSCPDLITSDVRLGAGTGIDAVQAICAEKPIAVVFITATAWEVRQRLAGAVVVQKPFGSGDLKRAVATARDLAH
ncbi:MAG TPA: response regulator [Allosphingosinicella sp.]|jgi:DNA-binding response OmpR family regulator